MWAVSYLPPPPPPSCHPLIIPNLTKPPLTLTPLRLSATAKSQPPGQDLGGLGHSILTQLKSNPKPTNPVILTKQGKQKQGQEGNQQMINGSDVLFALQRAAAKKRKESGMKKKKKKKKGQVSSSSSSSYVGSHREEEAVDDNDGKIVRPLCVKSEWGSRLDELEKRLRELSSQAI